MRREATGGREGETEMTKRKSDAHVKTPNQTDAGQSSQAVRPALVLEPPRLEIHLWLEPRRERRKAEGAVATPRRRHPK
jgi:hypothetical protein